MTIFVLLKFKAMTIKKLTYLKEEVSTLIDKEIRKGPGKKNIFSEIANNAIQEYLSLKGFINHAQRLGISIRELDITEYLYKNIDVLKLDPINGEYLKFRLSNELFEIEIEFWYTHLDDELIFEHKEDVCLDCLIDGIELDYNRKNLFNRLTSRI
jgi:hypothetical protein